ncbi:ROK family protein [Acetohalobium arabaticum]|uniref:Glucokinase n=1 Tax=Acetohalobium arabaticum (strain ATCC 49924 / DSM 5501 / Z-7288) TaxID=574087 RepID=D9QU62_ACEAZ|nr:ROK family protein [Acetohalobium arabaticum]ADL11855.1 glucokinase, ROK family [Acetohalobium arabaticum DSM 5501]
MAGYVIGVDLGGTKILTVLANLQGEIIAKKRSATKSEQGAEKVIDRILTTIDQVLADSDLTIDEIEAIGVGAPGPLSVKEGIIHHAPNLGWKDLNLKQLLESELNIPVFIENDANTAALGSKWFGAGKDKQNMIYLTVSTGIGSGIIIDNKLYHGISDSAGEVGHMVLDPESDVRCRCGDYGCWEALASGTALGRLGQKAVSSSSYSLMEELVDSTDQIDGAVVTEAAAQGDKTAKKILNQVTNYLGIGIANLLNILNPELIVVGGGVSQAGDIVLEPVREIALKRAMETPAKEVEIVRTQLGDNIGAIGAVAKALTQLGILN